MYYLDIFLYIYVHAYILHNHVFPQHLIYCIFKFKALQYSIAVVPTPYATGVQTYVSIINF